MPKISRIKNKIKQNRLLKKDILRFKRWVISLLEVMIGAIFVVSAYAKTELIWQKSDVGIDETSINAICIIKDAPNVLFAGGERAIYKSVNYGKNWYRVFMLKGANKGINYISYDPSNSYRIYVATNDGLYLSADGGKNFKAIFKGRDNLQKQTSCIAIDKENPHIIFIGTKRGLFQSKDKGRRWMSESAFVNKEVSSIVIGDGDVYLCAIDGVYYRLKGSYIWKRIYVQGISEKEANDADNNDGDREDGENLKRLNHISYYDNKLYLASDKGVSLYDKGVWQELSTEGLLTKDIRFILPSGKGAFAATGKGVFLYDDKIKRWHDISAGIASININALDMSKENFLFCATVNGAYRAEISDIDLYQAATAQDLKNAAVQDLQNSVQDLQNMPEAGYDFSSLISREPTIYQIQQKAIEYAEVSPEKIEWMRNAAKNKAWLPEISAGLDGDIDRSLHVDTGGTTNPDFYIIGPKDKSWGWDISANWDLGELIWNDDQTNIDVRSRLMVQLRNDVLDEVTKLYFERRRLQLELYTHPPKDDKEKILKELRLQELTAGIDGLTGGYLSRQLEDAK